MAQHPTRPHHAIGHSLRTAVWLVLLVAPLAAASSRISRVGFDEAWAHSLQAEADGDLLGADLALAGQERQRGFRYLVAMRKAYLKGQLGEVDEALRWYEEAHRQQRASIEPLLGAAALLLDQSRWDEAVDYAERAVRVDRSHYYANLYLGRGRYWQGELRQAAVVADKLLRLYPSTAEVLILAAAVDVATGEWSGAKEHLTMAKLLAPNDDTIAVLEQQLGNQRR